MPEETRAKVIAIAGENIAAFTQGISHNVVNPH